MGSETLTFVFTANGNFTETYLDTEYGESETYRGTYTFDDPVVTLHYSDGEVETGTLTTETSLVIDDAVFSKR